MKDGTLFNSKLLYLLLKVKIIHILQIIYVGILSVSLTGIGKFNIGVLGGSLVTFSFMIFVCFLYCWI